MTECTSAALNDFLQGPPGPTNYSAIIRETAQSLTIAVSDLGSHIIITDTVARTVTLPGGLPSGFTCVVVQGGAGGLTFAAGPGAVVHSRLGAMTTAAQWSFVACMVRANPGGNAAQWIIWGGLQ
jgi:hypothetical protein